MSEKRKLNLLEEIGAKYLKLERAERSFGAPRGRVDKTVSDDDLSDLGADLSTTCWRFHIETNCDDLFLSAETLQKAIDTFGAEAPAVDETIDLSAPGGAERLQQIVDERAPRPDSIIE